MEISFCSHPNTNKVIATIFGTWHDSWAVVACAKCCCDMIISSWIRAKWNFHHIWIVMEKSLVKWVPDLNVLTLTLYRTTMGATLLGFTSLVFLMLNIRILTELLLNNYSTGSCWCSISSGLDNGLKSNRWEASFKTKMSELSDAAFPRGQGVTQEVVNSR